MAGRVKATEYYYNWFFTQTASIRGGNSETLKQQEAKQQNSVTRNKTELNQTRNKNQTAEPQEVSDYVPWDGG